MRFRKKIIEKIYKLKGVGVACSRCKRYMGNSLGLEEIDEE